MKDGKAGLERRESKGRGRDKGKEAREAAERKGGPGRLEMMGEGQGRGHEKRRDAGWLKRTEAREAGEDDSNIQESSWRTPIVKNPLGVP